MNAPLAIGALGCSAIARRKTLPAIAAAEETRLAAVAARDPQRAAAFGARHGVAAMTYDELVDSPDVGAVYLSLPLALHEVWTRRALLAGKHVLCEKPLTGDPSSTKDLIDLAADRGLVLRENFAFQHHPQHTFVRGLIERGRFGALRTLTASYGAPPLPPGDIRYDPALGGGALADIGVYPIRLAWLLLGDGLDVVGAALRVDSRRGVDVSGHALLLSRDGVLADLGFGFQHTYRSRYEIWGAAASVTVDHAFSPPGSHRPDVRIEEQDHGERFDLPPADQFRLSLSSFAVAALSGAEDSIEAPWLIGAQETARLLDQIRSVATVIGR
ncbi:MAG: Gfo/Idh/MocA family oxidoreductase [Actinomycetota bacterium]|nr:Gfo/Idh/MocA family oxidoreductase [Actinomycetota bacterium]